MSIKSYRADGASASLDSTGMTETVVFRVEGLSGKPRNAWLHAALNATGIPRPGDAHPIQNGVSVLSLRAEIVSGDIARVRADYGVPTDDTATAGADAGTIDMSGSVQSEVVTTDQRGKPITVSYDTNVIDINGDSVPVTDVKGVELEVLRPQLVLRYTRIERRSPGRKALQYLGRVNSRAIWGGGARDWLCTDYSSTTIDRGQGYRVSYEFTAPPGGLTERRRATFGNAGGRAGGGWDSPATYISDVTGAPPIDLVPGEGLKIIQCYPRADFSRLRLPRLL